MLPDNIVRRLEGGILIGKIELLHRGHEAADLFGRIHTADPVILIGHYAQEFACAGAVIGHGNGGVSGLFVKIQHILKRRIRTEIGIADHKACLVGLDIADHLRLCVRRLRTVDERNAALARQRNGHGIVGYRLHYGRNHGNIDADGRFLHTPPVLDERCAQADIGRNAVLTGITRNEQVFAEGS